jgi:hypothetical protein
MGIHTACGMTMVPASEEAPLLLLLLLLLLLSALLLLRPGKKLKGNGSSLTAAAPSADSSGTCVWGGRQGQATACGGVPAGAPGVGREFSWPRANTSTVPRASTTPATRRENVVLHAVGATLGAVRSGGRGVARRGAF